MSESVKQVILRDPKTNEILIPKIIGTLGYEPDEEGTLVPPYTNDADTLGGKTADQFAAADHNHSGVYATPEQLNEVKTSVAEGKALVAAAVSDKGVETAADATFETMATNITNIQTKEDLTEEITTQDDLIAQISTVLAEKSGETLPTLNNPAGAEHILSGYEAIGPGGVLLTGILEAQSSQNVEMFVYQASNGSQATTIDIPSGFPTTKSGTVKVYGWWGSSSSYLYYCAVFANVYYSVGVNDGWITDQSSGCSTPFTVEYNGDTITLTTPTFPMGTQPNFWSNINLIFIKELD